MLLPCGTYFDTHQEVGGHSLESLITYTINEETNKNMLNTEQKGIKEESKIKIEL